MALIAEKTAKVTQEHKYVTLLFPSAGAFDKRFARFARNLLAGYLPSSFHALRSVVGAPSGRLPGSRVQVRIWNLFGIWDFEFPLTADSLSAVSGPLSAIRDMMPIRSAVGTQAQIVALAVYQLKSGGYEELHFGAIASALGVTRANIHHHFSSKKNLAQVALGEFIEDRLCRLRAMIDRYPSDFPSALDSIGEYLQKLSSDHPGEGLCACSALLLNNTGVPPSLKEASKDYFKELSVLFQAAVVRSQKAEAVQESVNAEDLAWECVLLMMGIGVLSGSLGVHELAHHPVPRLLRKKAREIGALSQDFLRAG